MKQQYRQESVPRQAERRQDLRSIGRIALVAGLLLLGILLSALLFVARHVLRQLGGDPAQVSELVGALAAGDLDAAEHLHGVKS